jgi:hypothetical protein
MSFVYTTNTYMTIGWQNGPMYGGGFVTISHVLIRSAKEFVKDIF